MADATTREAEFFDQMEHLGIVVVGVDADAHGTMRLAQQRCLAEEQR